MVELCGAISEMSGWFTIENHWDSYFWSSSFFLELSHKCDVKLVQFDQCAYGLRLPGASRNTFARTRSGVASNMPEIGQLEAHCPGCSENINMIFAGDLAGLGSRRSDCLKLRDVILNCSADVFAQVVSEQLLRDAGGSAGRDRVGAAENRSGL